MAWHGMACDEMRMGRYEMRWNDMEWDAGDDANAIPSMVCARACLMCCTGSEAARHLSLNSLSAPSRVGLLQLATNAPRIATTCAQAITKPYDQVTTAHEILICVCMRMIALHDMWEWMNDGMAWHGMR